MTEFGGFPQSHSVVVLDNFVTHKNPNFLELIERNNGFVEHLPPYSPDLNPVSTDMTV
jgi:transposase